ncbi:MAG: hypothetical protein IPL11_19115 [Candidatus Accumulibacter sp.]|nr:hypothetical protein [Accumulibacter sp.]
MGRPACDEHARTAGSVHPGGRAARFTELAQHRLDLLLRGAAKNPVDAAPPPPLGGDVRPGKVAPTVEPAVPFLPGRRYTYRTVGLLSQAEKHARPTVSSTSSATRTAFNDGNKVSDLFGNNHAGARRQTLGLPVLHQRLRARQTLARTVHHHSPTARPSACVSTCASPRAISITLPAGTFDSYRIDPWQRPRQRRATRAQRLGRPEQMRGLLAMESVVRKSGRVVSAERVGLTEHVAGVSPAPARAIATEPVDKPPLSPLAY